MALGVQLETPHGVIATYLKISGMQVYFQDQLVDVTLDGYVSKDARDQGKQPLINVGQIRLTFEAIGAEGEPTRSGCYQAIKQIASKAAKDSQLARLAGAVDC